MTENKKPTPGEINELQTDKVALANYPKMNKGFIHGDKVECVWWHELQGEERVLPDGSITEGYKFDFVDGTSITLTYLQLSSLLNDKQLPFIDTSRWTLFGYDKDAWKGTIAEEPIYQRF